MEKKYYWIKLPVNFFDTDEIKYLSTFENGYLMIYIYQNLIMKSVKNNGNLSINNKPMDIKTISILLGIPDKQYEIEQCINILIDLGLVKKNNKGIYNMIKIAEMIGSETIWAQYKRNERKKNNNVDNVKTMSKKNPIDKDKKIDVDEELDKKLDEIYNNIR